MDAPDSPWGTQSPHVEAVAEGSRRSWLRWAVGVAVALGLVGGGIAAYLYATRATPLPVGVSYQSEALVPGSDAALDVTVRNDSVDQRAYDVALTVKLPEKTDASGLRDETASSTPNEPAVVIGELGPGESRTVRLTLATELDPSSAAPFSMSVSHATAKDRAKRFVTETAGELVVRESAATVALESPSAVTRAEPFGVTLRYRNNTDKPINGARLELLMPRGLEIENASPAFAGALAIPSLAPKQSGTVQLTLRPTAAAPHEMQLEVELAADGKRLASRAATVLISSDAMAVSVTLGGKEEASVDLNQTLAYDVSVKNLAKVAIKDVQVRATLQGALYDLSSVVAQGGTLAAREPVVSWNGVGVPALRSIEPGASVSVRLSVRLVRTAPNASDASAVLTGVATSPTVPPGVSATSITASDAATARLAAATAFSSDAHWRDPLSQITNAGPQPPRVGVATQYAIRWSVRPSYAGLRDAVVVGSLAPGVRFTGKLGGVAAAAISYDQSTGRVTWRPGAVAANALASAAFQVEIVPAANQVGREVRLMDTSRLTAKDAFSGVSVEASSPPVTSSLTGKSAGQGNGMVRD